MLDDIQHRIALEGLSKNFLKQEVVTRSDLDRLLLQHDKIYKEISWVTWLGSGDRNTNSSNLWLKLRKPKIKFFPLYS